MDSATRGYKTKRSLDHSKKNPILLVLESFCTDFETPNRSQWRHCAKPPKHSYTYWTKHKQGDNFEQLHAQSTRAQRSVAETDVTVHNVQHASN